MDQRKCVYTVLSGGFERLLEQPVAARSEVDLICFTDVVGLESSTWEIRQFQPPLPLDSQRNSRRPKILGHEYLPEYDTSLYIDNTVLLLTDPAEIIDRFVAGDTAMAAFRHSFRDTVRNEFREVTRLGLDAQWVIEEQLAHYEATDPGSLDAEVIWAGMLFRRHHDERVRQTMITWWEHVLRYAKRDQLSLPFALRRHGLTVQTHAVDNYHSDFHYWPRIGHRGPMPPSTIPPGPEVIISHLQEKLRDERLRVTDGVAAVARLSADVKVRTDEFDRLKSEADQIRSEKDQIRSKARDLERRLAVEQGHALAAGEALRAAQTRTTELLASTSWRATAPLRLLGRLRLALRGLRSG